MCGIAGAIGPDAGVVRGAVDAMCGRMIARGPDDGGVVTFSAGKGTVALGNRRLAIVDPTPAGHQPMTDERGNAIVFNGMIYNHQELRAELERMGERFASDCDTEVVLRAYARFGEGCVTRLRGMFALAIWDAHAETLFLARDRMGIKPLYYYEGRGMFAFASQVKALLASGIVPAAISAEGVRTFLATGAVSEPFTAIDGVFSLPAGHCATLRNGALSIRRYWSMPGVDPALRPGDVAGHLRAVIEDSVRYHLISDAATGIFLSGGLDSSLIAALAARESSGVRTISVVFDDPAFSEAPYIERVVQHIGSEHASVTLRPERLLGHLNDAFNAMDQPTFDGLNTYIVAGAAADTGLKVALSGLGADELFDGYGHTRRVAMLERAAMLPSPLAGAAARAARAVMNGNGAKASTWLRDGGASLTAHQLLRALFLPDEVAAVTGAPAPATAEPRSTDRAHRVAAAELTSYTRDVLLRDTDSMSMAHSLEVRVPYLDDAVVDFAMRLPAAARGRDKSLLASVARGIVPDEIIERRKHGFALPLAGWMRGPLRDEVEATIARPPAALRRVINPSAMQETWRSFERDGERWLRAWALFALCRWARSIEVGALSLEEVAA